MSSTDVSISYRRKQTILLGGLILIGVFLYLGIRYGEKTALQSSLWADASLLWGT